MKSLGLIGPEQTPFYVKEPKLGAPFIAPSPIDTSTQAHRHNTIASNETPS